MLTKTTESWSGSATIARHAACWVVAWGWGQQWLAVHCNESECRVVGDATVAVETTVMIRLKMTSKWGCTFASSPCLLVSAAMAKRVQNVVCRVLLRRQPFMLHGQLTDIGQIWVVVIV
jgi:hypothetical protein